jgi:hypothetical protein
LEYALKATSFAIKVGNGVDSWWDKFANEIDGEFFAIEDLEFRAAVEYMLASPPRKQVLRDTGLAFEEQGIDGNQARAQQTLLMAWTVRNNLFHVGKFLPNGEQEQGRNEKLVSCSPAILKKCSTLQRQVRQCYEM